MIRTSVVSPLLRGSNISVIHNQRTWSSSWKSWSSATSTSTSNTKPIIRTWLVDAFAAEPFTGNPAEIYYIPSDLVSLQDFQSNSSTSKFANWMQQIAAEAHIPVSTFLYPIFKNKHTNTAISNNDDNNTNNGNTNNTNNTNTTTDSIFTNEYAIRWFTPTKELSLCGHGTITSAHVLYSELLALQHQQQQEQDRSEPLIFHTQTSGPIVATQIPSNNNSTTNTNNVVNNTNNTNNSNNTTSNSNNNTDHNSTMNNQPIQRRKIQLVFPSVPLAPHTLSPADLAHLVTAFSLPADSSFLQKHLLYTGRSMYDVVLHVSPALFQLLPRERNSSSTRSNHNDTTNTANSTNNSDNKVQVDFQALSKVETPRGIIITTSDKYHHNNGNNRTDTDTDNSTKNNTTNIMDNNKDPRKFADFQHRMFLPRFGINEDHVSGSGFATLTRYWHDKLYGTAAAAAAAAAAANTTSITNHNYHNTDNNTNNSNDNTSYNNSNSTGTSATSNRSTYKYKQLVGYQASPRGGTVWLQLATAAHNSSSDDNHTNHTNTNTKTNGINNTSKTICNDTNNTAHNTTINNTNTTNHKDNIQNEQQKEKEEKEEEDVVVLLAGTCVITKTGQLHPNALTFLQ